MRFSAVILAVCLVLSPVRVFAQFDFPNNPTLNQIVTGPSNQQFQWDGVKWVALLGAGTADFAPLVNPAGGQNNYAPLAAPTFTGTTTVGNLTAPGTATWTFPDGSTYTNAGHNNMAALGVALAAASNAPVAGLGVRLVNATANVNNNMGLFVTNQSNGTSAGGVVDLVNDLGHNFWITNQSSGFVPGLLGDPDSASLTIDGENGLYINTDSPISSPNALIRFYILNNPVGTFDTLGLFLPTASQNDSLHLGNTSALPYASIGSANDGQLHLMGGATLRGSQFIATPNPNNAAAFWQVGANSGGTGNNPGAQLYLATGLTAGNPFNWTLAMNLNSSGISLAPGLNYRVNNIPIQTTFYWQGQSIGVNYSTTATSGVLLDATRFQQSITVPVGYKLIAVFYGQALNSVAGGQSVCVQWGQDGNVPYIDGLAGGASSTAWQQVVAPHVWNGDGAAHVYAVYFSSCTGQGTSEIANGGFQQPVAILQMVSSN